MNISLVEKQLHYSDRDSITHNDRISGLPWERKYVDTSSLLCCHEYLNVPIISMEILETIENIHDQILLDCFMIVLKL